MIQFADDWVTTGWAKVDGKWIELGQSASVAVREPVGGLPDRRPDLTIHEIADVLNAFEAGIESSEESKDIRHLKIDLADSLDRINRLCKGLSDDSTVCYVMAEIARAVNMQSIIQIALHEMVYSAQPQSYKMPSVTTDLILSATAERDSIAAQIEELEKASEGVPESIRPMMLATSVGPLREALRRAEQFLTTLHEQYEKGEK